MKIYRNGVSRSTTPVGQQGSEEQEENADVTIPMMTQSHYVDAKVKKNTIKYISRWNKTKIYKSIPLETINKLIWKYVATMQ